MRNGKRESFVPIAEGHAGSAVGKTKTGDKRIKMPLGKKTDTSSSFAQTICFDVRATPWTSPRRTSRCSNLSRTPNRRSRSTRHVVELDAGISQEEALDALRLIVEHIEKTACRRRSVKCRGTGRGGRYGGSKAAPKSFGRCGRAASGARDSVVLLTRWAEPAPHLRRSPTDRGWRGGRR